MLCRKSRTAVPIIGPRQTTGVPLRQQRSRCEQTRTPCVSAGVQAAAPAGLEAGLEAHHRRDVGAGDVGVQQADLGAVLGQGDGEVDRDGGFADAALVGGDGDDVLYALDRLLALRRGEPRTSASRATRAWRRRGRRAAAFSTAP